MLTRLALGLLTEYHLRSGWMASHLFNIVAEYVAVNHKSELLLLMTQLSGSRASPATPRFVQWFELPSLFRDAVAVLHNRCLAIAIVCSTEISSGNLVTPARVGRVRGPNALPSRPGTRAEGIPC